MTDLILKPRGAGSLIKAHNENLQLAKDTWEQFYVTGILELGEQARPLIGAQPEQLQTYIANCGDLVLSSEPGIIITDSCPVIAEKKPLTFLLRDELLHEDAHVISKNDARSLRSITGPFTLVADNILIVERPGHENSIALIVRDAGAPSPFSECCPGGWVGPGDYLNTAEKKLNNELGFLMPDGKTYTFNQMKKRGWGQVLDIPGVTRKFNITVKTEDQFGEEQIKKNTIRCTPFFHLSADPSAIYDANMLNMTRIVKVKLPEYAEVVDISGFKRKIDLVPISDMDKPRYSEGKQRPQLPTVAYATRLAPALLAA